MLISRADRPLLKYFIALTRHYSSYDVKRLTAHELIAQKRKGVKLQDKSSTLDLTVRWEGYPFDFRVTAFWY
jgi:hypothetical protein